MERKEIIKKTICCIVHMSVLLLLWLFLEVACKWQLLFQKLIGKKVRLDDLFLSSWKCTKYWNKVQSTISSPSKWSGLELLNFHKAVCIYKHKMAIVVHSVETLTRKIAYEKSTIIWRFALARHFSSKCLYFPRIHLFCDFLAFGVVSFAFR